MATKTGTKTTGQRKTGKDSPKRTDAKTKAKVDTKKKLGALDAAARVLGQTGKAMNCRDLIEQMASKGLWSSPAGKTPHATLSAAIAREIKVKGVASRFVKAERGKFASKG
jgi:hypothetical protein